MPWTHNTTIDLVLYAIAGLALLLLGYRVGRWIGTLSAANTQFLEKVKTLETRVEDYRKKAAGFGGLFGTGGKRADAMYALLLENEALEEALQSQNEKLKQERT